MYDLPNNDRIQKLLDEYLDLTEEYSAALRVHAPFSGLEELRLKMEKLWQELNDLENSEK